MSADARRSSSAARSIRSFGWASLLHDIGAEMVFSVWPLFLTQTFGVSMTVVGFIDGVGEAVVSLSQTFAGALSDYTRRRKVFVWVGYLLGGLARIGYALATSWAFLVPFRVLDRSGKIRSTPRDAMVADLTTSADRGRRFGFLRLMDNTGAVIGVLVSIVLVGLVPMRTLFLLAALPSFAAVLLVWWRVREPAVTALHHPHLHLRDLKPNLWRFLFASACFELAAFSYSFLLLAAGAHGVSVLSLPWLYLLFTLSAAVVSLPAGWLVDRYGRRPLVQVALGVWLLLCLLFVFSHSMWALALGFILYGVHKGILDPAQKTLLTELAPREFRASVLGSFQLMVGTCSLLASLIAGLLWDAQGPQAPFLLSGGLTLVALLLMMRVTEERQHTSF